MPQNSAVQPTKTSRARRPTVARAADIRPPRPTTAAPAALPDTFQRSAPASAKGLSANNLHHLEAETHRPTGRTESNSLTAPKKAAGDLIGPIIHFPVDVVFFVGNAGLMTATLLRYKVFHPFNFEITRLVTWIGAGAHGEPPTSDPDLLMLLIKTQNPAFASLMDGFMVAHKDAKKDVVAVMRWAIATQGTGCPPTHNPHLLGTLIRMQEPAFGKLMLDYLAANPSSGADIAAVGRWAIETKGKGEPPTSDPKLLCTMVRTQHAPLATAMHAHLERYPRTGPEVAKVMRWAIATHGQGVPPTNAPRLLGALIRLVEPDFATLMMTYLDAHPKAGADVAAVERWAIETKGKQGLPPTEDPRLLATLIGLKEPKLATRLAAYAAKHPKKSKKIVQVQQWLIKDKGELKSWPPVMPLGLYALLATYGIRRALDRK